MSAASSASSVIQDTSTAASSSSTSAPSAVIGLDVEPTASALVPGVKVKFDPIQLIDYVLLYDGVEFHVHRYQLMVQSAYFRELVTQPYDNEPVPIPPFEYQSIVADEKNPKPKGPYIAPFTVQPRTAATATDFLLFLASLYWHDQPAFHFLQCPTIELKARVDAVGNAVPTSEYYVDKSSFAAVEYVQTRSSIFTIRYASIAWAFKYDCRSLMSDLCKQIEQRRRTGMLAKEGRASEMVVWLWLAETYSLTSYGGASGGDGMFSRDAVDLNSLRNELSYQDDGSALRFLPKLSSSVVSAATYQHMLRLWEASYEKLSKEMAEKEADWCRYKREEQQIRQREERKRKREEAKAR